MNTTLVSIIIPTYNEEKYIGEVIQRVIGADFGTDVEKEIIVVNDGSGDKTGQVLEQFLSKITLIQLPKNRGKGAALREGFAVAQGGIFLIQDADLEYDPSENKDLIKEIKEGRADVAYGSRFRGGRPHKVAFPLHFLVNGTLTVLSNFFSGLKLTDMETGSKAFRAEAIRSITLKENRFGFEPEVTIKLAKKKWRFVEVPISYYARDYSEGKKITWRDGLATLWIILRCGLGGE